MLSTWNCEDRYTTRPSRRSSNYFRSSRRAALCCRWRRRWPVYTSASRVVLTSTTRTSPRTRPVSCRFSGVQKYDWGGIRHVHFAGVHSQRTIYLPVDLNYRIGQRRTKLDYANCMFAQAVGYAWASIVIYKVLELNYFTPSCCVVRTRNDCP